jgi:nucleotide-binding universal stress UspA family protein
MYGRILVSVDDSEVSARALNEAVQLARDQHARLNVVHVVDTLAIYLGADENRGAQRAERAWRTEGRALLDRCRQRAIEAGVEAETTLLVPEGEGVCAAIVAICERWHADLIVTGTHGRCGIQRLLMGSVAGGIECMSPVAVLVIGCCRKS